jgi:hypothetical protein
MTTFTVRQIEFTTPGFGINANGRRISRKAFAVVRILKNGHEQICRKFEQGRFSWTPELAASLRAQAEAWAANLREIFP